ncbi:hypothetical protein [Gloeocapsopsis dulcis]|uniref:hypothetical protein n=1 Tax=Gloeocapsopsis dulcis TaxID=2859516 RepID=UPI0012DAE1D0|nr:hypothetical protein [Gloeocapsopsis dulcis]WNN87981.1 hypothetical protein P0S91_16960 [Gloeocapsopsis dulcis]
MPILMIAGLSGTTIQLAASSVIQRSPEAALPVQFPFNLYSVTNWLWHEPVI